MKKKILHKRFSKNRRHSKASLKTGLPPGSLVHVGEKLTDKSKIELIAYNKNNIIFEESLDPDVIYDFLTPDRNNWINLDGLHNISIIENIGNHFKLHHLLLEDVLNTEQRPKYEEYDEYLFFTLKTLNKIQDEEVTYEQISFVLGKNYLISFQEREGDIFQQLRERIKLPESRLRHKHIDYLFYRLIDTIVDSYYGVLEHIGERLEKLEEKVYLEPNQDTLQQIQELKKELIYLRKIVFPLREAIKTTMTEPKLISESTRKYLADVYDHAIQLIETVESYRDFSASLVDMYMTSMSNKMNEIMKVLTIIATIFIPLTFIVGLYGMNFEYMPELKWKYGYPATWGVMIMMTVALLIFFRKKKWL